MKAEKDMKPDTVQRESKVLEITEFRITTKCVRVAMSF